MSESPKNKRISNSSFPRARKITKFPIRSHVNEKYEKAFKLIEDMKEEKRKQ